MIAYSNRYIDLDGYEVCKEDSIACQLGNVKIITGVGTFIISGLTLISVADIRQAYLDLLDP